MEIKEHDIQKQIVEYLHINGWTTICTDMMIALKFIGNNQQNRMRFINYAKKQGYTKGQPDIIAVKSSETLFLEVKQPKCYPTQQQKEIGALLPNYHIVRNLEDIECIIKDSPEGEP